jgi:D-serine deaminase-like pyridoxal phosphate-dependent protein
VDQLGGIREIRPGNYVYFDATQAALGACALSEAAFFVLATVISANPDRLVLDTGALALSRDAGPRHLDPHFGFGLLADLSGSLLHEGLRVEALTQEHAVVPLRGRDAALGLGDRVLVLPNHACLSAACFDRVHVVQAGEIIGVHATCRGW